MNDLDFPRNDDGCTFNGAAVVAWLTARVEEKAGAATLTTEGQRWMTEFRKERALMAKIERKKAEGQLISRDEAGAEWGILSRFYAMASNFLPTDCPRFCMAGTDTKCLRLSATKCGNCEMDFSKMADTLPRLTANRGRKTAAKRPK